MVAGFAKNCSGSAPCWGWAGATAVAGDELLATFKNWTSDEVAGAATVAEVTAAAALLAVAAAAVVTGSRNWTWPP